MRRVSEPHEEVEQNVERFLWFEGAGHGIRILTEARFSEKQGVDAKGRDAGSSLERVQLCGPSSLIDSFRAIDWSRFVTAGEPDEWAETSPGAP